MNLTVELLNDIVKKHDEIVTSLQQMLIYPSESNGEIEAIKDFSKYRSEWFVFINDLDKQIKGEKSE